MINTKDFDWDSKKCTECHEVKPISEFYRRKIGRWRSMSFCKVCYRIYDARRYYNNRKERLKKDKIRNENMTPAEKRAKFDLALARSPEKFKARQAVHNAVYRGTLKKKPCEVCKTLKVHAHHTDYSKALDVVWLCKDHHYEQHRKYDPAKLGARI